jgi:hypothetical protein
MLTLAFARTGEAGPDSGGRLVNVWKDPAGRIFARAFADGRVRWIDWDGLGRFTFEAGSRLVHVGPAPDASPPVVRDMFARVVQPVILQALGWQALHGSAAMGPSGVVVFCGVGRSGKSTLGFAAGRLPGWRQVADDAVVLSAGSSGVSVELLPFRPKLRPASASFFDRFALDSHQAPESADGPGSDRQLHGDRAPLAAVVILSQALDAQEVPAPERMRQAAAFADVLAHAHCFDPADRAATGLMVRAYLEIAAQVPVFRVRYRPNFARLEALVASVMDAAAPCGAPPSTVEQA